MFKQAQLLQKYHPFKVFTVKKYVKDVAMVLFTENVFSLLNVFSKQVKILNR